MTTSTASAHGPPPNCDEQQRPGDRGSVTPLVIGMMLCLLLLGAGVIAAGSAVLARRNLQSACDGATASISGTVTLDQLAGAPAGFFDHQLDEYLANRMPEALGATGATNTEVVARCEADSPVTFGRIFGRPTVHVSVESASQVRRG